RLDRRHGRTARDCPALPATGREHCGKAQPCEQADRVRSPVKFSKLAGSPGVQGWLPLIETHHQDGFVGGRRAAVRASILAANSVSFSETSRRKVDVRRSVSGPRSSSTYFRRRAISSSMRRPISSNLSMFSRLGELLKRFLYYRNALQVPQGGLLPLPYQWQWRVEKWKNAVRGIFGGGNQQPRPKICPACGSLVGITATRCHNCGTSLTFSLAAISKGLSGFFGGRDPVTLFLLTLNLILFGVEWRVMAAAGQGGGMTILWGMGGEAISRLGGSFPPAIFFGHEWFRLVTAMFLHGGLIHIGFNLMVLMDIGPVVEEVYGSARYLFLYLATGAVGFLCSATFGGHPSVGASAPILGLIGLLIAMTTKRGGAHMQELRSRLISW